VGRHGTGDEPLHTRGNQNLTSIPGIGKSTAGKLIDLGVQNLEDLAHSSPETLGTQIPQAARSWVVLVARAEARVEGETKFLGSLDVPDGPRVYVDIETTLSHVTQEKIVWLVGAHVAPDDTTHQFLADSPDEEENVLQSLLELLEEIDSPDVIHYSGSGFDARVLENRLRALGHSVPESLESSTDAYALLKRSVALPISSTKLSEVAEHIGYEFKYPNLSGLQVAAGYESRVCRLDEPVPDRFLKYNRDDIHALQHVVEWAESRSPTPPDESDTARKRGEAGDQKHNRSRFAPVLDRYSTLRPGRAIVLSGLSKTDVDDLMSVFYQKHGPKEVLVRYSETRDGEYKALIAPRTVCEARPGSGR